jgi:hypothetical protein
MRSVFVYCIATLGAGLVVATIVGGSYWRMDVFVGAMLWGCAIAVVLGTPLYILLERHVVVGYFLSASVGTVIAVLPIAVLLWPSAVSTGALVSSWSGDTALVLNNVTTPAGWRNFWLMLVKLGAIGAAAAVAYHAIVRIGRGAA